MSITTVCTGPFRSASGYISVSGRLLVRPLDLPKLVIEMTTLVDWEAAGVNPSSRDSSVEHPRNVLSPYQG